MVNVESKFQTGKGSVYPQDKGATVAPPLQCLRTRRSQARPQGRTGDAIRKLDHVVAMPDDESEPAVHSLA